MPTPPARFTKQLVTMLDPDVYRRIVELSYGRGVSYATIVREALDLGLPLLESADSPPPDAP